MSDAATLAQRELLRHRKERVHSTMLVEVLALLIFMSMAFAFVLRDEASALNPWRQKYEAVLKKLSEAERHALALERENRELALANRQLVRSITGTISANDRLMVSQAQWRELNQRLANAEAVIVAQQKENAGLRDRLSGKGGSDLPNCTVSPNKFIVSIDLTEGGLRATPAWPASAAADVRRVTGLSQLASGQTLSLAEFRRLSGQMKRWGRDQATPCNFRATVYPRHNQMGLYRQQQTAIGDAFYATYR